MKKQSEPTFAKSYPHIVSIPNCDKAVVGLATDHALHCSRLVYDKWTLYNILGKDAELYCNTVNKSIRESVKRKLQPPLILSYDGKTLRQLLKLRTIFGRITKKPPTQAATRPPKEKKRTPKG